MSAKAIKAAFYQEIGLIAGCSINLLWLDWKSTVVVFILINIGFWIKAFSDWAGRKNVPDTESKCNKHIVMRRRYVLVYKAFADYECREFHITPVLTLSWPNTEELTNVKGGYVIAVEWGFWAAYIGYAYA